MENMDIIQAQKLVNIQMMCLLLRHHKELKVTNRELRPARRLQSAVFLGRGPKFLNYVTAFLIFDWSLLNSESSIAEKIWDPFSKIPHSISLFKSMDILD